MTSKVNFDDMISWPAFYEEMTGEKPRQAGAEKMNLCCPFHSEHNPSFWFNTKNGLWKCEAGCGSGNATAFLSRLQNITTGEAHRILLERAGISDEKKPAQQVKISTSLAEYSIEKALPYDFCQRLGMQDVKQASGPAYIAIPYKDMSGNISAVKHRYNSKNTMRFSWDKGGVIIPYGVWRKENQEADEMVLVEGESDAQTLWLHNIPALGIPGAQGFQETWVKQFLSNVAVLYIHQEPDAGGQTFRTKICSLLQSAGFGGAVFVISTGKTFPECKDPSDLHVKHRSNEDFADAWAKVRAGIEPVEMATIRQADPEAVERVKTQPHKMTWYSAADLPGMDLQPTIFVVDNLIPAGFSVIAAPPKTGKSWLVLDMAESIATGRTFWGRKTINGSVLYCALEDGRLRIRERLNKIGSSFPRPLDIVDAKTVRPLTQGFEEDVQTWIDAHDDARLIIIDTIGRIKSKSIKGLNAYESDYQMYRRLQEIAIKKNIAILAVTHLRKQNKTQPDDPFERISGSTGLAGVADCMMIISGKRDDEQKTLMLQARDVESQDITISFNKGRCKWQALGNSEDIMRQKAENEYRASSIAKTIITMVNARGQWHVDNVQDLINEIVIQGHDIPGSVTTVGNTLNGNHGAISIIQMLQEYDNIRTIRGKGGRAGRGYTFFKTGEIIR